ncbi:MAG: radical SAM protein, partial [Betaproteobacteria bacterium]|nr:radical SAM protein [Betaproteobacteria bacterium]
YALMEREHGNIDVARLEGWLADAYKLGSREIGLHSGAEPFASKQLEHFVAYCKKIGYEYTYISTNGSLATPKRMKAVIDAGIDSIKFSFNAGDRETYRKVHGKDHFDRVLDHLRYASTYRGKKKKPYIAISFVVTRDNEHTVEKLRELTRDLVDEFIPLKETNSSGQLPRAGERALKAKDICAIPFNKLHISWEGYMRVCCNDYENLLAVEDLENMSLEEAFYGDRFSDFRQRHLDDKLEGSLCFNCKYDCKSPVQPLNPDLYFTTHASDKGPPSTYAPIIFKK